MCVSPIQMHHFGLCSKGLKAKRPSVVHEADLVFLFLKLHRMLPIKDQIINNEQLKGRKMSPFCS